MQRWLIGGAVLVGAVLLAVFLIPSPDTGEVIDVAERVRPNVENLVDRRQGSKLIKSTPRPKSRAETIAMGQRSEAQGGPRGRRTIEKVGRTTSTDSWEAIDEMLMRHGDNRRVLQIRKEIQRLQQLTTDTNRGKGSKEDLIKHQQYVLGVIKKYKLSTEPDISKALQKVEDQIRIENRSSR